MNCRISKKKAKVFLDLGKMPLANGFVKRNQIMNEYFFPLKVAFSKELSLVQLCTNPPPNKMFNKKYPFYTSSSNSMKKHFNKFAEFVKKKYLKDNSLIIELGSNDGTFLSNFKKNKSYGFEPSKSVHDVAKKQGIRSINKFFNLKNISKFKKNYNNFDLIVGSNVFCHIPDQIELMKTIDKLLSKDGTIILEEPYLGSMYKRVSYDQIYDEHIYMFSLTSIEKIYKLFNFELIDAIPQSTHGGSMRYILKRKGNAKKSNRLIKMMKLERKDNVDNFKGCQKFKKKVQNSKIKLQKKIKKILSSGEKICGYGATSKSTTILNYCSIDNSMIDCIFDTTPDKINKLTPGTHIPIKNYNHFKKSNYKHVFLFAWNHKKEILKKEKNKKNIQWFSHL
jgi:SAM-dependent methyltransferase